MEGKKRRKKFFKSFSIFFNEISAFCRRGNDWLGRFFCETVEKAAFYYNQIQMFDTGSNMYTAVFEIFTYSGYGPRSQQ